MSALTTNNQAYIGDFKQSNQVRKGNKICFTGMFKIGNEEVKHFSLQMT